MHRGVISSCSEHMVHLVSRMSATYMGVVARVYNCQGLVLLWEAISLFPVNSGDCDGGKWGDGVSL